MGKTRDPNTLSNYDEVVTTHIVANLEIDFERKRLTGSVTLTLKSLVDHLRQIVLDARHVAELIVDLLSSTIFFFIECANLYMFSHWLEQFRFCLPTFELQSRFLALSPPLGQPSKRLSRLTTWQPP